MYLHLSLQKEIKASEWKLSRPDRKKKSVGGEYLKISPFPTGAPLFP